MRKKISAVIGGLIVISISISACSLPFIEASPLPYNEIVKSYEENDDSQNEEAEEQKTKIDLYSLDELILHADCIMTGTVLDILASKENKNAPDEDFLIYTDVLFEPHQIIYGRVEGGKIIIRLKGGKIGNLKIWSQDEPAFEAGEKCLLFLYYAADSIATPLPPQINEGSCYRVLGSMQGKYKYIDDRIISFNGDATSIFYLHERVEALRH